MGQAPSGYIQGAFVAPSVQATRRVEIYDADLTTFWMADAPLLGGTVTLDLGRSERRSFQLTLDNRDDALDSYPGGFWYDKVIKCYRGISYIDAEGDEQSWETSVGTFLIDSISTDYFPNITQVSGRDFTKKLLTSKFVTATMFAQGQVLEEVIQAIATNGGVTRFILPQTGKTLGRDFTFERGVERWKAIEDIATAYGYQVYFDENAYLVMEEPADPSFTPSEWTFKTGADDGNLVSYSKVANDTRIYNHIVVTGAASDQIPISAEALNTEPSSPTRIAVLGDRVYTYTSAFISRQDQAQEVADQFLKIHALESFELSLSSLVIPWLDVGIIVDFLDPDPSPDDPTRFLLTSLTIPLSLEAMTGTGRRVTVVT